MISFGFSAPLLSCQELDTPNIVYELSSDLTFDSGTDYECLLVTANNITIDGQGYNINSTVSQTAIRVTGYNDIKIFNLILTNFNRGIAFQGANDFNVSYVNITNLTVSTSKGIDVEEGSNGLIDNVYIKDATDCGVYLNANYTNITNSNFIENDVGVQTVSAQYSNNNKILDNVFENNFISGIDMDGGWPAYHNVSNNLFSNNNITLVVESEGNFFSYNSLSNSTRAIYSNNVNSNNNTFIYNNISNMSLGAVDFLWDADDVVFYNNRISNILGNGTSFRRGINNLNLTENYIFNCSEYGFYGTGTNDSVFIENEFTGNTNYVFKIENSGDITFNDNTLNNNPSNLVFSGNGLVNSSFNSNSFGHNDGEIFGLVGSSENIIFFDNLIYENYGALGYIIGLGSVVENVTINASRIYSNTNPSGIRLYGDNNFFVNNNITNNTKGVDLLGGNALTFWNNNLTNNDRDFVLTSRSTLDTLSIDGNLLTDNKLIYFNESISDEVINLENSPYLGILILKNSTNVSVEDFVLENSVFLINVNDSFVDNLTLESPEKGFYVYDSYNNSFSNNNITNSTKNSFYFYNSDNNMIFENYGSGFSYSGFNMQDNCVNNTIYNNSFYSVQGESAVYLRGDNNTFYNNNVYSFEDESSGLSLSSGYYNNIYFNNIISSGNSSYALNMDNFENNTFYNNLFESNNSNFGYALSIDFSSSSDNLFYNNTFKAKEILYNSDLGVRSLDFEIMESEDTNLTNQWNNSGEGNYWLSLDSSGFSETCTDSDDDGVCDSSYSITGNNSDYYPLVYGWEETEEDDGGSISSGGGFSGTTTLPLLKKEGLKQKLTKGASYSFSYGSETHKIRNNFIEGNQVNLSIESVPSYFLLGVEEFAKKDFDNDGFYDVSVEVLEIYSNDVKLFIKEIEEKIPVVISDEDVINSEEENLEEDLLENNDDLEKKKYWWVIIVACVLLIFVIVFYLLKKKKLNYKSKKSDSSKK